MKVLQAHHLAAKLQELFPTYHIKRNARKSARVISPQTKFPLELDFWIPDLKLAFEFQDPHHYTTTKYVDTPVHAIKLQDSLKAKVMSDLGESLIIVPCWWDGETESLVSTILQQRKDLSPFLPPSSSPPIDPTPPVGFFKVEHIPDVESLMLCTGLIPTDFSPTMWWISEKYDGVRICWNPRLKKLYGRYAREYRLPRSFISWFGGEYLDAEVWFGRTNFLESQEYVDWSVVRADPDNSPLRTGPKWHLFRVISFDVPLTLSNSPFEQRNTCLLNSIHGAHPFIIIALQFRCQNGKHVSKSLQRVLEQAGEGIILRERASEYERGRSRSLIKLKATRDQEGMVTRVDASSVHLLLPNGETTDLQIPDDVPLPKLGSIITFAVFATRTGEDEMPYRVRSDVTWDDLLRGYYSDSVVKAPILSGPTSYSLTQLEARKRHPIGYWTEESNKNMRTFFDSFAKQRNMDPLVPENWYSIGVDDIEREGGVSIVNHYGGSLIKALVDIYKEIPWDEIMFRKVPKYHWQLENNRRLFFDSFAKKHGFDPLIAEKWYNVTYRLVAEERGGIEVLRNYGHSIAKAISSLYPDIGLNLIKFHKKSQNFWDSKSNVREYFDLFAKEKDFDPLIAENWYSTTFEDIAKMRGSVILKQYHSSVALALQDIYPDIGIDPTKFPKKPVNYWNNDDNKREFFKQFAIKNGFDPLIATNWYGAPLRLLVTSGKGSKVLSQYNGSAEQALCDLFYDIGVRRSGFSLAKSNVVQ